jgi:peptidyl-prolyl cis-trans isomerase B (cyclophilin B)
MRRILMLAAVATFVLGAGACTKKASEEATVPSTPPPAPVTFVSADTNVTDPALKQINQFIVSAKIDTSAPGWKTSLPKPPKATFDPKHKYFAEMVTNKGPITIELMPEIAPMHVSSFIYLTNLGFYDGTRFHRVIKNFMAQGGDPLGTGGGGPGYQMDGEFSTKVLHDRRGRVSTANAGPGTDGSQFFLCFVPYPSLNGGYTIYGQVVGGMPTLGKLEAAANPGDGPPTEPLTLEKVTIQVK